MRIAATSAVLVLVVSSAWCGEMDGPLVDRLVDCAGLADAQRLACFDREVKPLLAARGEVARDAAPAAVRSAPRPEPLRENASQAVPLSEPQPQSAPASQQVVKARISGLRAMSGGTYIVSLDNGQAWRHADEYLGGYLREGEAVTITPGNLGSYRLTRDAGSARDWIRVARVR